MEASSGLTLGDDGRHRCPWGAAPPIYVEYHDAEWGRPVTDDDRLYEKLCLEGFQSGLSWLTILRKRDAFRRAFQDFRIEKVARFGEREIERLLNDASIVRHRGKIEATIDNARAALEVQDAEGSLNAFVRSFQPATATVFRTLDQVPSTTPESVALSKELKRRGFRFVGPTTVYAFFQAMGLVNDHLDECWVYDEVAEEQARLAR